MEPRALIKTRREPLHNSSAAKAGAHHDAPYLPKNLQEFTVLPTINDTNLSSTKRHQLLLLPLLTTQK